jgi:hypothetical protein
MMRAALLRTGQAPSAPGSANGYSRSLLDRIRADGGFEIENTRELWMDAILECNAPFYGEVVTLYDALACYRIHDGNDNSQNSLEHPRFAKGIRYCRRKLDYLAQRCLFTANRQSSSQGEQLPAAVCIKRVLREKPYAAASGEINIL